MPRVFKPVPLVLQKLQPQYKIRYVKIDYLDTVSIEL